MKRFFAAGVALAVSARVASAAIPDTYAPPTNAPSVNTTAPVAKPVTPAAKPAATAAKSTAKTAHAPAANAQSLADMQAALDQLTKSNHDLLDLLKQQQSVLQDMQYDRRLQSRQIQLLEERLEEALLAKRDLEAKVDKLESQAAERPAAATSAPSPAVATTAPPISGVHPAPGQPGAPAPKSGGVHPAPGQPGAPIIETVKSPEASASSPEATPPPPATYLPPEGADNPPGPQTWHRLFALKGSDSKQTDVFLIRGRTWRVLWHNQDKPGKLYENTSALFVNAFPRDDTIPVRVASKLGSGGDSTELKGPGNYYLKIEASGGNWELAVEDLR